MSDRHNPVNTPALVASACAIPLCALASLQSEEFRPYNPFEVKHRKRITREQFKILEQTFQENPKPNATLRRRLAQTLSMSERGIQVWFQNRRAKVKAECKKRQQDQRETSSDHKVLLYPSSDGLALKTSPSATTRYTFPTPTRDMCTKSVTLPFALPCQHRNTSSIVADGDTLMTPAVSPPDDFFLGSNITNTNMLTFYSGATVPKPITPSWDTRIPFPTPASPPHSEAFVDNAYPSDMVPSMAFYHGTLDMLAESQYSGRLEPFGILGDAACPFQGYWTSAEAMRLSSQPIFDFAFDCTTT